MEGHTTVLLPGKINLTNSDREKRNIPVSAVENLLGSEATKYYLIQRLRKRFGSSSGWAHVRKKKGYNEGIVGTRFQTSN